MEHFHLTPDASELDELRKVKESFQIEMVSSYVTPMRLEFLREAINMINVEIMGYEKSLGVD